jgi:hypothetical protein
MDAAKYGGHSLRAAHATTAAIGGPSERSIMKQTGIGPCRWCGGIFGTGVCFGRIARESGAVVTRSIALMNAGGKTCSIDKNTGFKCLVRAYGMEA